MPAAVELDLKKWDSAATRMLRAGADVRPAWRKVRGPMRKDQAAHIVAQSGPGGAWPPLAASTRARRMTIGGRAGKHTKRGKLKKTAKRKLGKILSKKLTSGAKVKIDARQISIRSKVPWGGIHQKGGIAGRGSRIPARPFMWISDQLAELAAATIARHLRAAWDKGKLR